jgi:hypothetical protein
MYKNVDTSRHVKLIVLSPRTYKNISFKETPFAFNKEFM